MNEEKEEIERGGVTKQKQLSDCTVSQSFSSLYSYLIQFRTLCVKELLTFRDVFPIFSIANSRGKTLTTNLCRLTSKYSSLLLLSQDYTIFLGATISQFAVPLDFIEFPLLL